MKAFILAAGLGTRLKPWTLHHPKALVPVGGVPMLERVICALREQGFDDIVINVHHFAEQIIDFVSAHDFGVRIRISDECTQLLDTGGGLAQAAPILLAYDDEPVLVHNVDILSNANLRVLMEAHKATKALATLLVSERKSSRQLYFDATMSLRGWQNLNNGATRPDGFTPSADVQPLAFSGIHVVSAQMLKMLVEMAHTAPAFPIMDFYLSNAYPGSDVKGFADSSLDLIDIGKPESLTRADQLFDNP